MNVGTRRVPCERNSIGIMHETNGLRLEILSWGVAKR